MIDNNKINEHIATALSKSDSCYQSTNVIPSIGCLYQDACLTIDQAQQTAYRAVNETLIKHNRLLGMRIQQEPTAEGRAWYENEAANEMWSTLHKRSTIDYNYL